MEGEEDELVAAVADEDVAAVDARLYDLGDAAQCLIAAEVAVRVVDLLEVVDVEDGVGEGEAVLLREPREPLEAGLQLEAVVAAREEVMLCLVLRYLQLLREGTVFPRELRILYHLLADEEEDERDEGVDREDGGRERRGKEVVLKVQGVDADEEHEGDRRDDAVAARRVFRPRGAQEDEDGVEEGEAEDGVEDEEHVHIAVSPEKLYRRSNGEEYAIEAKNDPQGARIAPCGDVLGDLEEEHRHEVEHDEVQLRPDLRRAEEARKEGGGSRRPQDEAQEEGDEVDLQPPPMRVPAPDEIHDEEDDERGGDGEARRVDGIGDADLLEECDLAADEEVVKAAEPLGVAGVQEEGDALSREGLRGIDEVERAAVGIVAHVPRAVHIE